MEELLLYLSSLKSKINVGIFLREYNYELISKICKYGYFNKCIFVLPTINDDYIEKKRIDNLNYEIMSYDSFGGFDDCWQMILCDCEIYHIFLGLHFHPNSIVGYISAELHPFDIWKVSRKFVDYYNIVTYRNDNQKFCFIWNKGKNEIELSVIIPVYNVEKYIDRCIKTLLAWKASYVEFIFVSDGSTDNSVDIIKKYMVLDHRIKLYEKENGGCASARQFGLDVAIGRYIGFVDPDDFIDERMFYMLLSSAMNGGYDISYCGYNEYYDDDQHIAHAIDAIWYPYIDGCYCTEDIIKLIVYSRVAIWRAIYRREYLIESNIHFYKELPRFDDLPFKVETLAYAKSIVCVPEYLYYYRLNREGQDVSANDERLFIHFDIFNILNRSIGRMKNAKIIDCLQMCKVQTHRYALSKIKKDLYEDYRSLAKKDLLFLSDSNRLYKITNQMLGNEALRELKLILQ